MKEEINKTLDNLIQAYQNEFKIAYNISESYGGSDFIKKIAVLSEKIIQLAEEEHLTYKESYFLLEFTYNALKYKQEQVSL